MKSTAHAITIHRKTSLGMPAYKQIRPATTSGIPTIKVCRATCTVSGSAGDTYVTTYGTPVNLVGDGIPDLNVGVTTGLKISPTLSTASGSVYHNGPPRSGLVMDGAATVGMSFYQNGDRLSFGSTDWITIGSFSQYGHIYPYGYYGGRYNMAVDVADLMRGDGAISYAVPTQSWDPPYTPSQIGISLYMRRWSGSITFKMMIMWTPD